MPFSFLAELQKEFLATHSREQIDDAPAHGMKSFDAKIAHLMVRAELGSSSAPVEAALSVALMRP